MRHLFFAAALAIAVLFVGQPAACVYCPTYPCFARCTNQYRCVSSGPGGGDCYSIQATEELIAHGFQELP